MLPEVRFPAEVDRRRVYDWDEFSKIPGCTVGPHSSEPKNQSFAPSPTVAAINNAVNAAASSAPVAATPATPAQIKSIDEYNSQNPNAPTAVRSLEKMLSEKTQPKPMKGMGGERVTNRWKGAVSSRGMS